jgi:hypothetical protein
VARINIEEQFWDDIGIVAARVGDYDKAVGQALRLIKFGQSKFKQHQALSYKELKEKFSFIDALIPEFARREGEDLVIISGAQKHFSWLLSKSESGQIGGRISAQRERNAKGQLETQAQSKQSKQTPSAPSTIKQTQASPSSSNTAKQTTFGAYTPEMEILYAKYPKRGKGLGMKKKKGMELFNKIITSTEIYLKVEKAVNNYAESIRNRKQENTKFILQWSNFFNEWEEWESMSPVSRKVFDFKSGKYMETGGEACLDKQSTI